MDLEKFFDRVNHDKLMGQIAKRVEDKRLLKLIRAMLNAGVMENGMEKPSEEGTPQGGPLSPLLSNLVLDELDRELGARGHRFVRYADDCNIYVRSERAGQRVMESVKRFIASKLKLKVNEAKSAVANRQRSGSFWDLVSPGEKRPKSRIAPQAILRFKDRIRELTRRTRGISIERMIEELRGYIDRLAGLLRILPNPQHTQGIGRMDPKTFTLRDMETVETRAGCFKKLRSRGIGIAIAAQTAGSAHGPWRLSNSPALDRALPNAFFDSLGLLSLAT